MRVSSAFSRLVRLPGRVGQEGAVRAGSGGRRGRAAASPAAVPALRVLDARRARTRGTWTRSGGISISASGGWRSTAGADGCAARATACSPRACRSPATAPGSRATSSAWSRGWPRASTSRRSAGCSGSTGTPSGGSSRACAPTSSIPTVSASCSTSGVDEVSWKRQHNYLTLVADHRAGKIVWGTAGAGEKAADRFFAELDPGSPRAAPPRAPTADTRRRVAVGPRARTPPHEPEPPVAERAGQLAAISLDMGPGYAAAARWHAPQAVLLHRPVPRRPERQQGARRGPPRLLERAARLRRPTGRQALQGRPLVAAQDARPTSPTPKPPRCARLKAAGGEVWRGYTLKEATRGIFAPGLTVDDVEILIDRLLSRLARSRLEPVRPARQDDPQAPRRHPRRRAPGHQPRPHRSAQQQGPADRPPRLRLPHRPSRARPRDAHLRPDHAPPAAPASRRQFTVTLTTSMPREPVFLRLGSREELRSRRSTAQPADRCRCCPATPSARHARLHAPRHDLSLFAALNATTRQGDRLSCHRRHRAIEFKKLPADSIEARGARRARACT